MRIAKSRTVGLALTCLILTGAAYAQSSRDRDLNTETGRGDGPSPALPSSDGKPTTHSGFELIVTSPFLYTTNAIQTSTGDVVSARADWHIDPDLLLKWSHQFSAFRITASGDVAIDRYARVREADTDTLLGSVKVDLTDGRSDLFVPFLSYQATVDFEPLFKRRDDVLHDLAAGFKSGVGFNSQGGVIAYRDAIDPGNSYVSVNIQGGRRFAYPRDLENTFFKATAIFGYIATKELELTASPQFRARWYPDYFGEPRRDFRPGVLLKAIWTPDWLRKILPRAEIDFTAEFQRNFSNLPEKAYKLWEIGPTVEVRWKF